MQTEVWILLLYSLPAQPSAPRVQVWRRLNLLGALRLPAGGFVLPERPENRRELLALQRDIVEHGGSAALFRVEPLSDALAAELREQHDAARAAEYVELERECKQLRAHIQHEIEHFVFTYEEIEELDAELAKLRQRFEVFERRDVFGVIERASATAELEACSELLTSYAAEVFERETNEGASS